MPHIWITDLFYISFSYQCIDLLQPSIDVGDLIHYAYEHFRDITNQQIEKSRLKHRLRVVQVDLIGETAHIILYLCGPQKVKSEFRVTFFLRPDCTRNCTRTSSECKSYATYDWSLWDFFIADHRRQHHEECVTKCHDRHQAQRQRSGGHLLSVQGGRMSG